MVFRVLISIVILLWMSGTSAQSLVERLDKVFRGQPDAAEILHPDEAFRFEISTHPSLISINWQIEEGYYLYRDKFKFSVSGDGTEIRQEAVNISAGKMKQDPAFGMVEINTGEIVTDLPLQRMPDGAGEITLELGYQGCKENSVCYPPAIKSIPLVLPSIIGSAQAATDIPDTTRGVSSQLSPQDAITEKLKDGGLLLNMLAFFGFGLLLSLTPCVFPMIPILSGIIVGQGDNVTTGRAFGLSLSYVLAMALTYAVLGVIAGLFHFNLQAAFQQPWIIVLFSGVFVALALSMFGFYELQLPAALQTRLNNVSGQQSVGTVRGAAVMGSLSAIIVGPCVAPPLAGALLYISQTGNAWLGGMALFAMGLGFGVPLLIIGSSAGSLLPRAGDWMTTIKHSFGVIMIAVAIWFLGRIVPPQLSLVLWASLFIVVAVYLGALDSTRQGSGWQGLWKGVGVLSLVYGIILVIGAAGGGTQVLQPLQGIITSGANNSGTHQPVPFSRVRDVNDLDAVLDQAQAQGKLTMLDFYADWCVVCKEMEAYTLSDARVQAQLDNMVLVQADVTKNNELDRALLERFELFGPPAILFFDANGNEQKRYRVIGFVDADSFSRHIEEMTAAAVDTRG